MLVSDHPDFSKIDFKKWWFHQIILFTLVIAVFLLELLKNNITFEVENHIEFLAVKHLFLSLSQIELDDALFFSFWKKICQQTFLAEQIIPKFLFQAVFMLNKSTG